MARRRPYSPPLFHRSSIQDRFFDQFIEQQQAKDEPGRSPSDPMTRIGRADKDKRRKRRAVRNAKRKNR